MAALTQITVTPEFIGHPSVVQQGIVRLGGFWQMIPRSFVNDGFGLYVRYIDLRAVDIAMFQRGVPRSAAVTAPITFALVATVMRVVGPLTSGPVDVTLWSATTEGRTIGFGSEPLQRVWDLGGPERLTNVRLEVVGETVPILTGNVIGYKEPTASVGYDWIAWEVGEVEIYA